MAMLASEGMKCYTVPPPSCRPWPTFFDLIGAIVEPTATAREAKEGERARNQRVTAALTRFCRIDTEDSLVARVRQGPGFTGVTPHAALNAHGLARIPRGHRWDDSIEALG